MSDKSNSNAPRPNVEYPPAAIRHMCKGERPSGDYGPAITDCWEDNTGRLWTGNGEYASQVSFCPFCGFKASNDEDTDDEPG